jgi:two-component system NtrC family sensor kinase
MIVFSYIPVPSNPQEEMPKKSSTNRTRREGGEDVPFRDIAEMGNDGILVCNGKDQIVFANQVAAEITECSRDELVGRGLRTLLGKQYRTLLKDIQTNKRKYGRKFCTEMEIVTPRGDVKEAEVCIASSKSNGKMKTYVYLRDITERKRVEREMRESEEKYKNLFERARHGIFVSTKEGKFLDCNPALLEMLGYRSKKEFLEIDIAKDLYLNPEDRRAFRRLVEKNGFAKDFEVEFKRKDGRKIIILLTAHPIRDERGEIIGYQGLNVDITERKEMVTEIGQTNEFLTKLIASSGDCIIAADMKGNIIIFNRAAEELLGYRAEEVMGKVNIVDLYPPGEAKEIMKKLRSEEFGGGGKLTPQQFTLVSKSGEHIPIQLSASVVYDEQRGELASVGFFTDLRPRIKMEKELEETHLQLVNSEKMASLGKLAAGIAHEINNPLGGILIYSSLMMEELGEGDSRKQDLDKIVQEATRCKDIVKSLLEFSRQTEPKMEPVDINKAITDGLFFLENQALFHNIEILKNLDPLLPNVRGNPSQLKQVFMNIIVNAAEAMHGGGTLTITTTPSEDQEVVWIDFTDTGEGIPRENLSRIFDPFFTTKELGKGTGLGLSTSYGIIDGHGGRIDVKSQVGRGTSFRIELPVESGDLESP